MSHPHKITIRKEIEGNTSQLFERVKSMKGSRSYSRERKKQDKLENKKDKELKLEEYVRLYQNNNRGIPTTNKLQLFRKENMLSRSKAKLQLK